MHPAVIESFTLLLMGTSGIGLAALLGVRNWVALSFLAVASATVIRTWTAFLAWSWGLPNLLTDFWVWTSAGVALLALVLKWRQWREILLASLSFGVMSIAALATKYVFDVGERHHSDSAAVVALSVLSIQGESENLDTLARSYKRGISYPLMLGLGPEGRILGGFTPLVYIALLVGLVWIAWRLLNSTVSRAVFLAVVAGVAAFSISVPIFRAAMFYLNAHTLMGFGMLLLVGGILLAQKERGFSQVPATFILLGGVVGATARIEGIVLVLVAVVALVDLKIWKSPVERLRLFFALALTGLSLTWWLIALNSPVLERLNAGDELLVILLILSLVGAGLASSSLIDRVRGWFLPLAASVVVFLLARIVWQSDDPLSRILAQWPNLGLGEGGWATAAPVFIGSLVLLGWRQRSDAYRLTVIVSIAVIGAILFSKTFDGGFGRPGFYDSVNRMWLQVMPVIALATLIGYAEIVQSALRRRRSPAPVQPAAEAVTGPTDTRL